MKHLTKTLLSDLAGAFRPLPARTLMAIAGMSLAIGCGGAKKGPDGVKPPPKIGDGDQTVDRTVTREAKKDFQQAVAAYQKQAEQGWSGGACEDIADKFKDVANDHPKLIEARFNAGMTYQHCNMLGKAEEQYRAALKINNAHADSIANIGQIYFLQGKTSAAKQYWEQAVKANQKLAAPRNNLAWLIIKEIRARPKGASFKDLEEKALRHLQSALAVENDNVEAYVLLALLYMEGSERNKSRLTIADLLLKKAEERNAKFAPLWNARGLLLMRREDPANALKMFGQAVGLDPNFTEARLNAGNIVLDFRKYDEAEQHFGAVLKKEPKSYEAMVGLGMAQRAQRKFAEAEASYKKAQKLSPQQAEADFNLGILYMSFKSNETEDLRKAQAAYRTALGHFRKVTTKSKADADLKKEAQTNIKLCEKAIKSLTDAIRMQQQMKNQKG